MKERLAELHWKKIILAPIIFKLMTEQPSDNSGHGQLARLTFRKYRHTDLERCTEITDEAWPELSRPISLATVEWYLASANRTEVACVAEKPIGILFGRVDHRTSAISRFRISIAHATVYLKVLLGLYGRITGRLKLVKCAMTDDRNIEANTPKVDGEVVFFAVDSSYRRQGIGRALMDRFIQEARTEGAKTISVYTTDPGSDWGFYERYGFEKQATFKDSLLSFLRKEEVKALIYVLGLEGRSETQK